MFYDINEIIEDATITGLTVTSDQHLFDQH